MGKNIHLNITDINLKLIHNEELLCRSVLFEKHQVYFYSINKNSGECLELCNFNERVNVHIGSQACKQCVYNIAFDSHKQIIVCRKLTKALKK